MLTYCLTETGPTQNSVQLKTNILFVFIPKMLNISQRNTAGNVGCSSYFSSEKALAWCSILILWPLNSGDWAPRATELNGTLLSHLKTWTKDHSPPYLIVFLVIGLFSFCFVFRCCFLYVWVKQCFVWFQVSFQAYFPIQSYTSKPKSVVNTFAKHS